MMRTGLHALFLLALFRPSHGQNCPLLGPAYPPVTDVSSSPVLNAAKASFRDALTELLASGQIDNSTTSFSLQVFGREDSGGDPIFEYYHTALAASSRGGGSVRYRNATVGSRTLYRIGSISKLVSVYAILAKLGAGYWNEPVTKYVSELADAADQGESDAVDNVQWSEVTLGALASQMSGIGRDYALGDLSAVPISIPGLPALNETEIVQCGASIGGLGPCTREESMKMILKKQPVLPAYQSPIYSNMAFQLLAYAIENITGQAFATVVEETLVKPLGLSRTFVSVPLNDTDAAVVDGWAEDLGDAGPAGGYVQSVADLSRIGQSILASSLLSSRATREWLKPVSHTSSAFISVGRPWEILRVPVRVSNSPTNATTGTTRLVDVYSKNGGLGQYVSILGLSPDHGIGVSILAAGPKASVVLGVLQGLATDAWLRAAEEAAREQARLRFAGLYTPSPGADNSSAEITLLPDEPGLFLGSLVSNGTDMFQAIGEGVVGGGELGGRFGAWLYPTTLGSSNGSRVAFRAIFGAVGRKAEEICLSWGSVDGLRYGGQPADLLVFELGEDDDNDDKRAVAVEIPLLRKVFRKSD